MGNDRIAGAAPKLGGDAEDAARDLGDDTQGELARLRGQVSRLMDKSVTPALDGAAAGYARQAKDAVVERSEKASAIIQEQPLLAVGLGLASGYPIGRLMGATPASTRASDGVAAAPRPPRAGRKRPDARGGIDRPALWNGGHLPLLSTERATSPRRRVQHRISGGLAHE